MSAIKIFTLVSFLLLGISVQAQKKSNVKNYKIKSTTVLEEDYDESKGKQVKESFTRFDALGNTVEEVEYDKSGKEKNHVYYDYDTDGNKIRETYLKSNGTKDKVIENKYDADGNKIGETYLKPNGTKDKTVEYKYQDGLKSEKIVYFANGKIKSKKKYVYDLDK